MATITLQHPFEISSRLQPSVRVGGATINLEYSKRPGRDGRTRYSYTIDLPDGSEHSGDDLQSGRCGGDLQGGFKSLLSYLGACGEGYSYQEQTGRAGENADLFPEAVAKRADEHADELTMLACEIEESVDAGHQLIEEG